MGTTVRAPHPNLRGLVTPYYGYRYEGMEPGIHHGLPGTGLTVVLSLDEPLDVAWAHDDSSRTRSWTTAAGLHDGPALIRHDGFQHGVQFELTPSGARRLLGLPAAALRGSLVPLEDLLPLDRLYDDVASAGSWRSRFDLLDRALLGLAAAGSGIRSELGWAWQRLLQDPSERVADLAGELGWSRRHLTASFTAEYGVGPKQVARIVRFKQAHHLLRQGRGLADVATEAGYADQSHLTREWRDLAGCTPAAWLRAEFPFLQDREPEDEAG